jgi:hypothetical protein
MSLEKKLSQLSKSKDLQPNQDWEKSAKHELLLEIHAQNRLHKAQQLTNAERFDLVMMKFTRRLMPSVTKLVAAFLIVAMGSGTAFAAQASVPGQVLWPVKRSIEKAELTLAFNPVKETEVHIKHINKRLSEIDKIVEDSKKEVKQEKVAEKVAKQEKAIKQAVRHLEKDAVAVDTSLKIVKEEKKPLEVVELAKKVKEATKETKKKVVGLEERVTEANGESLEAIEEALEDVKTINEEVTQNAVNVVLQIHEDILTAKGVKEAKEILDNHIDQEQAVIDDDEIEAVTKAVIELITEDIDDLTNEIKVTQDKVNVVEDKDIDQLVVEKKELVANDDDGDSVLDEKDIQEVRKQSEEAGVTLDQAKVLLEEGSLKDAADKLTETKKIQYKTETVLKEIEKSVKASEEEVIDGGEVIPEEPVTDVVNDVVEDIDVEAAAINPDQNAVINEESDLED